jgi:hypothetical protein
MLLVQRASKSKGSRYYDDVREENGGKLREFSHLKPKIHFAPYLWISQEAGICPSEYPQ